MTAPSQEHSFDSFAAALTSFPVFATLSHQTLKQLDSQLSRVTFKGGETLFHQGEPGDCLYVVVYGRLRVSVFADTGQEQILRELGRGEPVGEMAILTGEPRSATVRAVRDTELIRLSKQGFERLVMTSPAAMLEISRLIISRLKRPDPSPGQDRMSAVALLPANKDIPIQELADGLVAALSKQHHIRRLDSSAVDHYLRDAAASHEPGYIEREVPRWLHEQESKHDMLVYVAEPSTSEWTGLCLRQADTVLVVANADQQDQISPGLVELLAERNGPACCRTELVLLYDSAKGKPSGTNAWLELLDVADHHHIDPHNFSDVERLCRMLTHEAIGLVLGGGGARGFAHIGVLRAMEECGVPVDLIGGTSMGSIVAALRAMGLDWQSIRDACQRAFIESGSLDDYTLPVMALLAGRRYKRMLVRMFGEQSIEDLPIPFFCVSTNLTRCIPMIHRRGLLHRWVGASIAVPGLGPPLFYQREVLVDGGVVNNLPADVMKSFRRGPVLACSVTPDTELPLDREYPEFVSPWWVLFNRLNPFAEKMAVPGIGSILMQTAWLSQATAGATVRKTVDVFFEPPVANFKLRDWHALDQLIELGYRHALEKIAAWKET